MATGCTIWDILPYLRRFASALTGNLATCDALIKLTVASLSNDVPLPTRSLELRILIFKRFLECARSDVGSKLIGTAKADVAEGPERILAGMGFIQRQAFLLHTMEAFSVPTCAVIMGITESECESLFSAANLNISSQTATDVLIIEDEGLIAHDLERIVRRLGHRVLGLAKTRSDVPRVLCGRVPGLILADIRLSDKSSGIDAVNDILRKHSVPVIFITSYPEELLTAVRPSEASLLAKPFVVESVRASISQALLFQTKAKFVSSPSELDGKPVVSGSGRLKQVILN